MAQYGGNNHAEAGTGEVQRALREDEAEQHLREARREAHMRLQIAEHAKQDRTSLILEIFSDRAQTNEGKLQVEMAALSYQRTRLVRAWTHLERQRGGLGFVGGPGETQIEADRRAIDQQLTRLRKKLSRIIIGLFFS